MLLPQSHSGFYHTPLSKCMLAVTLIASFILQMPFARYRNLCIYDIDDVIQNFSVWRILTSKVVFLDTKDCMLGGLLIYYFRIFERRFGSKKYMNCLLTTGLISVALELISSFVLRYLGVRIAILPSGPFGLIFPFYVPYFIEIPRVAFTHICGVPVTGKTFTYILGLQIAMASVEALVVCACGVAAGLAYRYNFFAAQRWSFLPSPVTRFASHWLSPLLQSPAPAELSRPMGATLEAQRQEYMERLEEQMVAQQLRAMQERNGSPPSMANGRMQHGNHGDSHGETGDSSVVDAQQIQRLVDMGFSRESAVNALRLGNNNIQAAMYILLHDS